MEEKSVITLRKVRKRYPNGLLAVHDFSLDVKEHEFIVLVGPSGCGKSTTLRMIAGLEEITAGELYMNGRFANNLTPKDRDIAMVFQSYALYPHMSVYNNLAFGLRMRGKHVPLLDKEGKQVEAIDHKAIRLLDRDLRDIAKDLRKIESLLAKHPEEGIRDPEEREFVDDLLATENRLREERLAKERKREQLLEHPVPLMKHVRYSKEEIRERVASAAKVLEIEPYLNAKPREMSGGQRQRVALGRALVRSVGIFLMDEPLSNLDAKLRVQMRSEIVDLHRKIGTTTIYVTHDQTEAMTMADRIVVMKDGLIQQIGTPKEIYNHPANLFVATFVGSPAMNIFPAEIKEDGTVLVDGSLSLPLPEGKTEEILLSYKAKVERLEREIQELDREFKGYQEELADEKTRRGRKRKLESRLKELSEEKEEALVALGRAKDYLDGKDRRVKLGIRPENIHVAGEKTPMMTVESHIPELLGNRYYIHGTVGDTPFVFEYDTKGEVKEGDKIPVLFDTDALHFFDKEDGNGLA